MVTGVLAVALAGVVLVYVPNLFLTKLTSWTRSQRVALATIWFFVALASMAWALRRLQAHGEV